MSISSLFAGMEAYLDGDVEINNNVGAPDDAAENAEIADQTAEVASDTADATEEAKDTEVASQMLSRMCDMYDHVKQFGIDRTFVSLYNRHGELDRVCGMQFPSCESMDVVGDRYSMYSTAFIAAMESSGSGLWAKIKAFIAKIWNWFKTKLANIWNGIRKLFGFQKSRVQRFKDAVRKIGAKAVVSVNSGISWLCDNGVSAGKWVWNHKFLTSIFVACGVVVAKLIKYFYAKIKKGNVQQAATELKGSVDNLKQKIAGAGVKLETEVASGDADAATVVAYEAVKVLDFSAGIIKKKAGHQTKFTHDWGDDENSGSSAARTSGQSTTNNSGSTNSINPQYQKKSYIVHDWGDGKESFDIQLSGMEDDQPNTTTLGNIDKAVTVISKETSASTGTTNQVVTNLQNGVKDLNQLAAQADGETEGKLGGLISKAAAICQKLAGLAASLISSAISLVAELTSSIKSKIAGKSNQPAAESLKANIDLINYEFL